MYIIVIFTTIVKYIFSFYDVIYNMYLTSQNEACL